MVAVWAGKGDVAVVVVLVSVGGGVISGVGVWCAREGQPAVGAFSILPSRRPTTKSTLLTPRPSRASHPIPDPREEDRSHDALFPEFT